MAVTAYDGAIRDLVVAYKESGARAALRPLAGLLADSIRPLLAPPGSATVLVPVPSRASSVRGRGLDTTWLLTRTAAASLAVAGSDVIAWHGLRMRAAVRDQAGLGAGERAVNLAASMTVDTEALRRLAARRTTARIVVCDDVITTGASAREAQRALAAVGLRVHGIAVIAATQRRHVL